MGVKPLFYTNINGTLIFGSEIKSILSHPDYVRDINYDAVYHYFTFKNIPAPLTAFKGIYSLLPGEMLIFSNGKIVSKKWWKIQFNENENYDEEFVKEKILSLLEDSTRLRMISDVPFGAYLSGGVDSSSIVALMTRFSDKPIKTFSLGYEGELKNKEADMYYARKISAIYKTEHYEYIMSHRELIDEVENVITAFDQPFSGTISTYFLSKLIKQHVKVALSGDGADELFGSYLSHRTAQPMYHFNRLYERIKTDSLTDDEKNLFAFCDMKFLKDIYNKSEGDEVKWRYNLYLFSDAEKGNLLSDKFKSMLNNTSTFALVKRNFEGLTAKNPLNRILEMEWNTQLPDQVLAFVDFLSMAHSVEIRSPFLDYRLVEFAASIPANMKIKGGN
ncbi:MAG: asparagine synthase-related protein, partial [Thermoproteota archaeon]